MWACVCTSSFACQLFLRRREMTSSTPPPPSMTIASPVRSSPTIVQLHASGPASKVSHRSTVRIPLVDVDAEVVKAAVEVSQRRAGPRFAREDVSDQNRVRADGVLLRDLAIEVRDCAVEHGRARGVDSVPDVGKLKLSDLSRKVLGEAALVACEHVDAEDARRRNKRVAPRLAIDADQERGRIQRNACKRIDGNPARFAVL